MPYSPEWKQKIVALADGPVGVALLCGADEADCDGYERQTVTFKDGSNTGLVRFGPFLRPLSKAITGYALYKGNVEIGRDRVAPQRPQLDESSTFAAGSLRMGIEG